MTDKVILYGHSACPMVGPTRKMLSWSGVDHEYINIHKDAAAAEKVRAVNLGNESVPTLFFPDGSFLTEPSTKELKQKLESLGYHFSPFAWVIGNIWTLVILVVVLLALLRILGVF
jgi:mycoredoxin